MKNLKCLLIVNSNMKEKLKDYDLSEAFQKITGKKNDQEIKIVVNPMLSLLDNNGFLFDNNGNSIAIEIPNINNGGL